MTVMSDVVHDARVSREARALQDVGHDVTIIGLEPTEAASLPADLDVRWARASSPFPRGRTSATTSTARQALRWALLPAHVGRLTMTFHRAVRAIAEELEFDVVHAHDFDTLEVGASLAEDAVVPYIYDTHECWLGRKRQARPTPLADRRTARREAELGERAHAVITVGEGLADWLSARYGWDHVAVVRNSFPTVDESDPPLEPHPRGLLYAGRIGRGRELEVLASASKALPLPVTLLGPQDANYIERFGDDLEVRAPVSVDEVDDHYRRAGIGLVLVADGPINHRVALPNKLFQAVRAGVPVVATDLPEIRRVVHEHRIGALYTPGDAHSLRAAVERVVENYGEFRQATLRARPALSWSTDADRLVEVYRSLVQCT